jgi:hypothetical protein
MCRRQTRFPSLSGTSQAIKTFTIVGPDFLLIGAGEVSDGVGDQHEDHANSEMPSVEAWAMMLMPFWILKKSGENGIRTTRVALDNAQSTTERILIDDCPMTICTVFTH